MGFALVAELPLGTYRGHAGSDDIDLAPSVARLHAALVCAAGSGPSAELDGDRLVMSGPDAAALEWLEVHPPDGLAVPRSVVNRSEATAYRGLGLIGAREKRLVMRKVGRPADASVAVAGPYAWVWDEAPPGEVAEALTSLCAEVSHLGMAETPVRLSVDDVAPTHRRHDTAELFSGSGLDVEVPAQGRTGELIEQHRQLLGRPPSASRDRHKTSEEEQSFPPRRVAISLARYRPLDPVGPALPWSQVLVVPIDRAVDPGWRVRWAVAAHRALVALVGDDAPAVLTGAYPEGAARPANRLAIHFLGGEAPWVGVSDAPGALAVLVPTDAVDTDVEVVRGALAQLGRLRGPGGRTVREIGAPTTLNASQFWDPVAPGCERRWLTVPAAMPDGRPPRRRGWSMADAVALSVALVWRDVLGNPGHGSGWQVELTDKARRAGVSVEGLRMLTDGDLTRYVHKVNPGVVVRPYRALVDLGELAGPQALVAIGQSRHLGGGLLQPIDVTAGEARVP